jgi:hypothetical protein
MRRISFSAFLVIGMYRLQLTSRSDLVTRNLVANPSFPSASLLRHPFYHSHHSHSLLVLARSYPERSSEQFAVAAVLFIDSTCIFYRPLLLPLAAFRGSPDDARLVGLNVPSAFS